FKGMENVTGGPIEDYFQFYEGGSISGKIEGQLVGQTGHRDFLDYSNLSTPLTIDVQSGEFPFVHEVVDVSSVIGTPQVDTVVGPDAPTNWYIGLYDTVFVSTPDRFVELIGFESLQGGKAADTFNVVGQDNEYPHFVGTLNGGDGDVNEI